MSNIDVRDYIIGNFKDDNIDDIRKSIEDSIKDKSDDTLIGLGVFFELMWKNCDNKDNILNWIRKGLH